MQTITKYIIIIYLSLLAVNVSAQETEKKLTKKEKIEALKQIIIDSEKDALKIEVEQINEQVVKKEITYKQGENLKKEAAKKRALNINNRISIMENKIEFNIRNNLPNGLKSKKNKNKFEISFGNNDTNIIGVTIGKTKEKPKYDIRTSNDIVMAIGFNNAIIDGQILSDSPYKIGGSGFAELGWNWKTRLGVSGNSPRLKYGFMFQWNRYELKNNKIFVQNENTTSLETFPADLKQSEFRNTNLVFPLYFEFGPMKKIEKKDRIRFINNGKFKFGVGAYAGFNIGSQLKLRYKEDGNRIKQKIKQNFNVNDFIYGIGTYIGIGDISLYAKYDLSKTFKNANLKQNNISLGLRVDLD